MPGGDPHPTATAAGGTHPTGMHSCLVQFLKSNEIALRRDAHLLDPPLVRSH